ncbi:DNA modification methylase [uncultured Mediterranean phage uvDeep-CGR1-KM17-C101]|nr:DNA modification methylase [uncultured Mediterranean phage uvDeep-CGR1-KM17-C101]
MEVKEEFKNLIPALSVEEYAQLEANILEEGIREPIITWNGFIIDGHNRFSIAQRFDLEYKTTSKHFNTEIDVKIWMANNQLGRRNLSDYVKGELMEEIENLEKEKGKKNISANKGGTTTLPINGKEAHNTQEIISKKLGWSKGKKSQFDVVKKKAPEEVKEKLRNNEITIHAAYQEIKKEEKKEEKIQERKKLAEEGAKKEIEIDFRLGDFEEVFSDLPDGSIDCIITDPPYPYEFIEVWSKLSRFAKRVLKPNGYCVAYSGQMYLPEVMKRMSENLDYYWTFAVYHEGQTQIVNGINLMCRWKPVLIFQNGKKKIENTFQDYFISEQREKNGHDWQQSKSGVAYLIEMFTKPMDIILEPFAGSGTTIIAAKEKKRKVLAAEINEQTYNIAKALL